MNCSKCGSGINDGARFCSSCGASVVSEPFVKRQSTLLRPRNGRMIAGVCAAFANEYGWDVTIVRLVVALVVLFGCGSPFLAYIVAWIVIPEAPLAMPMVPVSPTTAGPYAS